MTNVLTAEEDGINSILEQCGNLNDVPAGFHGRFIRKFFENNGFEPDFTKIKLIEDAFIRGESVKLQLTKGKFVLLSDGDLSILSNLSDLAENLKTPENLQSIKINFGEEINFCEKQVKITKVNYENFKKACSVNKNLTNYAFSCDIIDSDIFIRKKLAGDKYKRVNRNFESRLKKLYNEFLKPDERVNNIIVCDKTQILWVENFGAADFAKITENTENVAIIEVKSE
jgi:hypothetical protein